MKRSPHRRFAYRLAVKLGHINIDAMCRMLTAKQFLEWEQYASIEPFDEVRADYRAASIAQMVFNMAVAKESRKDIETFVLKWGEDARRKEQTIDENIAFAKAMAAAQNMTVVSGQKIIEE